ncbi:hypothetical protein HU200_015228 [Digitaria exilis]|uniref:DUF295 domain-containing protein n=1 Tax=Digitaria exilis TaxID=1010633 RepID=A0A835F9Y2_9POAL|nr:hypothetical protein HU200_015228 [Digitaria exilis]
MATLSWSDLPPDLLVLVLECLPSLADRVRLRAVCHPWRSNARQHSRPPLLTLPDGTFLSIPDGEVIRMPVPKDARCCGSVDSWLFLMEIDGGCPLVNPFSRVTVELPKLGTVGCYNSFNVTSEHKPVIPSALDLSPDSLVALLILHDRRGSKVCICQPPIATDVSSARASWPFDDIAFFNGKLHGLGDRNKLFVIDMDYESDKPKITSIRCIISYGYGLRDLPQSVSREKVHKKREYLVECCGRLLRVRRFFQSDHPGRTSRYLKHHNTVGFDVFEAGMSANSGQWRKVNNLGGQALFVGRRSKSLPAVEHNGIQRDCIYFLRDYCPTKDPLRDSGMYNMRTGMITPLLSETVAVPQLHGGNWCPTWIFPYY